MVTLLGIGLGVALGWGLGGGLVLGLVVSVASTVVLLRAITDRGELDTPQGRIAIGWLIVEDLVTVVILVLLPTIAPLLGGRAEPDAAGGTGRSGRSSSRSARPPCSRSLMSWPARGSSRGCSSSSPARVPGAVHPGRAGYRPRHRLRLVGGVRRVIRARGPSWPGGGGESDMSHQAAADALPLRDAFAVLFFVSVGMLLDPAFLARHAAADPRRRGLIVVAQPLEAFRRGRVFGHPMRVGLTVAAGLAQIGEFSFILGTWACHSGCCRPTASSSSSPVRSCRSR